MSTCYKDKHAISDATLWVCVDCAMLAANGETPEHMTELETAEWLENLGSDFHAASWGIMADEHADDCTALEDGTDCECADQSFSWASCDGCGSRLGGARFGMTVSWCNTCTKTTDTPNYV